MQFDEVRLASNLQHLHMTVFGRLKWYDASRNREIVMDRNVPTRMANALVQRSLRDIDIWRQRRGWVKMTPRTHLCARGAAWDTLWDFLGFLALYPDHAYAIAEQALKVCPEIAKGLEYEYAAIVASISPPPAQPTTPIDLASVADDDMESSLGRESELIADGYPPALAKACFDSWHYTMRLHTGETIKFSSAIPHGPFVHLLFENFDELGISPQTTPPTDLQRGIDVRVSAIDWAVDGEG